MKAFKAYDIRGVYPSDINEDIAYKVGRAFVTYLKCKNVVVGRDARESSPSLFKALVRGITDQGADLIDIGITTTPLLNFTVASGYDSGIMISASHNPAEYNAFKLIKKPVLQMHTIEIQKIKELVEKSDFEEPRTLGNLITHDPLDDYIKHVMKFCEGIDKLRVVVDYGNGVGAITAQPLFNRLNLDIIPLYEELDGTFPNHPANPHDPENFEYLQKAVKFTAMIRQIIHLRHGEMQCSRQEVRCLTELSHSTPQLMVVLPAQSDGTQLMVVEEAIS